MMFCPVLAREYCDVSTYVIIAVVTVMVFIVGESEGIMVVGRYLC